ncbi:dihydrolipoyl dehydrogenase [Microbacterium caowuchunii]|uniref:Dihydrolipoyl dehydrogenase n=1 Tax=Microbacterium caowuchunii TaxID=2614638 RepID=A0A5N0TN78_9MICO|nr:dihydrolipoyl dehydrogenase [Microbacterium caowuchunii]KAA9135718.1 dihydrolipoyl dehydrogenase [Microbacterium caowuchunii]
MQVDVAVIGGGSGGYAAAIRAAELGKSVVVIERDKVGGTCLHRGCIPTKALLHVAETADAVREAAGVGVLAELAGIDVDRMNAFRETIVAKKYKGLQGLLRARGVEVLESEGRISGPGRVTAGDTEITATDIIVATGARTRTLPGLEIGGRILSSEQALELREVPERVIVLGGGVIGVEFASLWRSLGAEVTVVEALDQLVPTEDEALRTQLSRAFRKRGIQTRLGARFASATQDDASVTVTLEDGDTLAADYLLVAVGRAPVTEGLGLEEAGVRLDRGFVVTDRELRTDAPGIWAVGDIVPGPQLAHRGFQQGIQVAERIAGQTVPPLPDENVPRIVYTSPELASVGLTRAQAEERHGAEGITVLDYNLAGNAKTEILGGSGTVRVIRRVDGPVVGVHLAGPRVGELISEAQLIIGWDAHPEDVAPLVHAHPTQSEALGEAFLALAGKPLHVL